MAKLRKRGNMYYSDFTSNDKRIIRALSVHKPQAEAMLADLVKLSKSEKNGTQPNDVSWFYFREKYLQFVREFREPGTYEAAERALNMIDLHGRLLTRLGQMTPEYMEDFQLKCKAKKLEEKTVLDYLRRVKTAIKWAEARMLVKAQNWTLIKTPAPAHRIDYMDYDQLDEVLASCKGHWKTAAMLMAWAGLRSGEVRHLDWTDIDFRNRLIHIRAKNGWAPKGSKPGRPKNRVVDMPKRLEDYLQRLQDRSGNVLMGGSEVMKRLTYGLFFRRVTKKVGFKVYAHKFRHTYASFMVSAGVSLPRLGELMGHTDARSTQVYAHLMPHARRTAVDQMEASLPQPGPRLEVLAANA